MLPQDKALSLHLLQTSFFRGFAMEGAWLCWRMAHSCLDAPAGNGLAFSVYLQDLCLTCPGYLLAFSPQGNTQLTLRFVGN